MNDNNEPQPPADLFEQSAEFHRTGSRGVRSSVKELWQRFLTSSRWWGCLDFSQLEAPLRVVDLSFLKHQCWKLGLEIPKVICPCKGVHNDLVHHEGFTESYFVDFLIAAKVKNIVLSVQPIPSNPLLLFQFSRLQGLESFTIEFSEVRGERFRQAFDQFFQYQPQLKEITFSSHVSGEFAEPMKRSIFQSLRHLSGLQTLDLSYCEITGDDMDVVVSSLVSSGANKSLRRFELNEKENCNYCSGKTALSAGSLAPLLECCKNLQKLEIAGAYKFFWSNPNANKDDGQPITASSCSYQKFVRAFHGTHIAEVYLEGADTRPSVLIPLLLPKNNESVHLRELTFHSVVFGELDSHSYQLLLDGFSNLTKIALVSSDSPPLEFWTSLLETKDSKIRILRANCTGVWEDAPPGSEKLQKLLNALEGNKTLRHVELEDIANEEDETNDLVSSLAEAYSTRNRALQSASKIEHCHSWPVVLRYFFGNVNDSNPSATFAFLKLAATQLPRRESAIRKRQYDRWVEENRDLKAKNRKLEEDYARLQHQLEKKQFNIAQE